MRTPGASCWTPPITAGETLGVTLVRRLRVLEHGLRRGSVEDHLFGREKCVVSGHKDVMCGIHRGLSNGIVNVISRSRLNPNRNKRLTWAVSDCVAGLAALVACTCPLTGLANPFLGFGHQPPWL